MPRWYYFITFGMKRVTRLLAGALNRLNDHHGINSSLAYRLIPIRISSANFQRNTKKLERRYRQVDGMVHRGSSQVSLTAMLLS